ncbi:Hypp4680 [Branchiostoma lanceolatum]|uniref:Hypp4680 protein n=1 Tax=Branchiostoma lanceolatum TaxID=7740 RepID=A0A8K0AA07_BRALA|nr:Hypp4680 [Branchiostoma lanceolatum]
MSDNCPPGSAWDKVVEDCVPCSLCKEFPATAICQKSPCRHRNRITARAPKLSRPTLPLPPKTDPAPLSAQTQTPLSDYSAILACGDPITVPGLPGYTVLGVLPNRPGSRSAHARPGRVGNTSSTVEIPGSFRCDIPPGGALPTGAVVGIVVSCVVVMAAVLFLAYRMCRRDRDVTTRPVQVATTEPGEDSETQRLL